jgi:exonuclease III
MVNKFQSKPCSSKVVNAERVSNLYRFMTTKDDKIISTSGQSNIKNKFVSKSIFQIYHQNIQGIKWKTDEILDFLSPALPHVLCFTEHHLNRYEIEHLCINNYTPGANYCRHTLKKGGVCIFVHNGLDFIGINLEKFCNDKDIEACAIKLLHNSYHICILSIYRAPLGNFTYVIKKLKTILNSLHNINTQYIICGDININYLVENNRKKILDALLASYNLFSTVYFPTRLQNNSATAIDNIFVDTSKFANYVILPLFNSWLIMTRSLLS